MHKKGTIPSLLRKFFGVEHYVFTTQNSFILEFVKRFWKSWNIMLWKFVFCEPGY